MVERILANEVNRIKGALEVLGILSERLVLQLEEIDTEPGRGAVKEMLTQVNELRLEYQRHQAELHPHHKSYQFFLTDDGILPILHDCYADLVTNKAISSEFAGKTLRLADWYVRMEDDVPKQVVNETYSWLVLDELGRTNLHAAQAIEASPLPTQEEWDKINMRLFAQDL